MSLRDGRGILLEDGWTLFNLDPQGDVGMYEVVSVLKEILDELKEMNSKLDSIQGDGLWNSISDVHNKLDDIETIISVL